MVISMDCFCGCCVYSPCRLSPRGKQPVHPINGPRDPDQFERYCKRFASNLIGTVADLHYIGRTKSLPIKKIRNLGAAVKHLAMLGAAVKRLVIALLAVSGLSAGAGQVASAADLPMKAPPMVATPVPFSWTGFYVGVNAGGTWARQSDISVVSSPIFQASPAIGGAAAVSNAAAAGGTADLRTSKRFIGGGQAGYNWQLDAKFVAGIEADIQGLASAGGSSATATTFFPTGLTVIPGGSVNVQTIMSARSHLDYLGTVRGRIGHLFTPALLGYATGGLAYGGVSLNVSGAQSVNPLPGGPPPFQQAAGFGGGTFSGTRVGWTAGVGVESKFWRNWSAKAEYLHYDLGSFQTNVGTTSELVVTSATAWINATSAHARFDGDIVRVGLNYFID
jgi:outer membrane immunogenic protein